jgi:cardiolipin synthase
MLESPFIHRISELGGKVRFYNKLGWLNLFSPSTWFPRNHSKTMLIDSRIAYVGSACITERMRTWRDVHVRITGDLVHEIEEKFSSKKAIKNNDDQPIYYVVSRPGQITSPVYQKLLEYIHKAEYSICLVTPYFIPPVRLYNALRSAIRRGVDVHILISSETDVPIADLTGRTYIPHLLSHGFKISIYEEAVLHSKYALIDNSWATLGSTNLDYLSLLKNRESNLIIQEKQIVAIMKQIFIHSLEKSRAATAGDWYDLPLQKKITGYLGQFIRKIL